MSSRSLFKQQRNAQLIRKLLQIDRILVTSVLCTAAGIQSRNISSFFFPVFQQCKNIMNLRCNRRRITI